MNKKMLKLIKKAVEKNLVEINGIDYKINLREKHLGWKRNSIIFHIFGLFLGFRDETIIEQNWRSIIHLLNLTKKEQHHEKNILH